MPDVTGIRNARVVLARRFDTAPAFGGITLGGVPFPATRRAYGRSYANRSVPIQRVKSTTEPARRTIKIGGVTFTGSTAFTFGGPSIQQSAGTGRPADAVPIEYGSQVSLRLFDFKVIGISVVRNYGGATIDVDFTVPNRDTGEPLTLTYHQAILPNFDKHYLAEQTSIALARAFEHEVRERLYLGAKHFIEPHPESNADGI